ncbi:MAG: hypothetical protein M1836_005260 [Candelina mexicana]|nr:MAG: hypothetical protein M1836_005260 [Candelina mexicana]
MHTSTTFAGFFALTAPFLLSASTLGPRKPLGINCRGSGACPIATWQNSNSNSIIQILRNVVRQSSKDPATTYQSGDHVVCVSSSQPVTVSAGADTEGAGGEFSLSGTIHEGGICLFPKGTALTLGAILPLLDAVLEHGCKTCGSVPIHYVDQGSNDPKDGILTFNYVKNPSCTGDCIFDGGKK